MSRRCATRCCSCPAICNSTVGGPAQKWDKDFRRRTVYGEVSRFRPERFLTLFDFPDPSIHAEKRMPTNTSVQRLFFLNSEFMKHKSARLGRPRPRRRARTIRSAGTALLCDLLFGRAPEPREVGSRSAVSWRRRPAEKRWPEFAQVLLSSSEFSFVD